MQWFYLVEYNLLLVVYFDLHIVVVVVLFVVVVVLFVVVVVLFVVVMALFVVVNMDKTDTAYKETNMVGMFGWLYCLGMNRQE